MFFDAVTLTLARYSDRVLSKVCDPLDGMPSKFKFLPALAEINEACQKANGTWRPPDGTLSPQGYVYDSTKIGGINFLAEPRNRKFYYDD
jgi:hypothetical protein